MFKATQAMSCESSEANAGKSLPASQLRPKSRSVHRDCEASERNGGSLRDRRASEWGPREAAGRTSKRSAREEAVRGGSSEQEGSERECVTVFFLSILGVGGKGRRQRVEPNMGRAGLRLELRPALYPPGFRLTPSGLECPQDMMMMMKSMSFREFLHTAQLLLQVWRSGNAAGSHRERGSA